MTKFNDDNMNSAHGNHDDRPELDPQSQRAIDLLVDGELSDADERALLASLDAEDRSATSAWRRVALAFVEAQCLRRQMRGMTDDTRQSAPPHQAIAGRSATDGGQPALDEVTAAQRASQNRRSATRRWQIVLAMAASFLIAFALGSLYRGTAVTQGQASPIAATGPAVATVANGSTTAPVAAVAAMPAPASGPLPPSIGAAAPAVDHSTDRSADAPIVLVRNQTSGMADDSPAVPQRVVDALRRMGHRVEQRRATVPVRLPDGRTVTMPLEQLDVDYKGQAAFQ
ncbi:MAG: hypothetical protein K8T25_01765 [Planctomycetia bacterium]|nr:hypothetical protein [Planctomycetia bacterium]